MSHIDLGPLQRAVKDERSAKLKCEEEMAEHSKRGHLTTYGQLASWPAYEVTVKRREALTEALYDALELLAEPPIYKDESNDPAP